MLTHEIIKPRKTLIQTTTNALGHFFGIPQSQLPVQHQAPKDTLWDKLAYARWLESVKQNFWKGNYYTRKGFPEGGGSYHPTFYKVIDFEEIHHFVEIDKHINEPRAVLCHDPNGKLMKFCPSELRTLTAVEYRICHDNTNSKQ